MMFNLVYFTKSPAKFESLAICLAQICLRKTNVSWGIFLYNKIKFSVDFSTKFIRRKTVLHLLRPSDSR
jgi:hypothetical protein